MAAHRAPHLGRHVGVVGQVERDLEVREVRWAAVVVGQHVEHRVQPFLEGDAGDLGGGDGVLEVVPAPVDDREQQLLHVPNWCWIVPQVTPARRAISLELVW